MPSSRAAIHGGRQGTRADRRHWAGKGGLTYKGPSRTERGGGKGFGACELASLCCRHAHGHGPGCGVQREGSGSRRQASPRQAGCRAAPRGRCRGMAGREHPESCHSRESRAGLQATGSGGATQWESREMPSPEGAPRPWGRARRPRQRQGEGTGSS